MLFEYWLLSISSGGEADTGFKDGMLDISNIARIGCSEVDQLKIVIEGIRLLIQVSFHFLNYLSPILYDNTLEVFGALSHAHS